MSSQIEKPWALMRHHAGWADVFRIDSETVGPPVTYSVRAVLARFDTFDAAHAAREGGVAEWRKHDVVVREAEAALKAAEQVRENAWTDWLKAAAK